MPWRRRYHRLLIDPRAQLKLFAPFFVFMLGWTSILMIIAWIFQGMIGHLSQPAQTLAPYQIEDLQKLNLRIFKIFMWGSGVSVVFTFGFWLAFSHTVFGPMVQIHRQIKRLSEGETDGVIKLRPNDEFEHVAKAVNELTEKLKNKAG